MWARLRAFKTAKDGEKLQDTHKSLGVNEQYKNALRTQSYVEFFTKAHLLISEPSGSPQSSKNSADMLLEPEQDIVPSILEVLVYPKAFSDLKLLMFSYFDTSAEASRLCTHLLRSINETHSNYELIQRALEGFTDHSHEDLKSAISELGSFNSLTNPFSSLNQHDFKLISDRYSSILHHLKSKRKAVAKRIKIIQYIKKASGFCLTITCSVVALVAIGIAVHSLTWFLMGPALLGFSPLRLKKKFSSRRCFQSRFLRRLGEQLDAAAKGTYILNRDFDTLSRLVARLHDEVEHNKEMVQFWFEREDKFSLKEVVKELKKSGRGFKRLVDELEEHVCLCLVTINRARVLVVKETSKP